MVTELLQCSDAGQVCVSLRGALKAGSEDSMGQEMPVKLYLQRGRVTAQRPIETRRQIAVDDLLCPPQDEHASQARELNCSLFSQNPLLLLSAKDMRYEIKFSLYKGCRFKENKQRELYLCAGGLSGA